MISRQTHYAGLADCQHFEPYLPLGRDEAEALAFLLPLSEDYPGIDIWYRSKVVPGLRDGSRTLLRIEREGTLVGLGIGKKDNEERKICTVRVAPSHAGRGIGVRIFDGLLKWLDHDRPHLTVTDSKLPLFERIFDYYGFDMTSAAQGRYVPHACELGYNEVQLNENTVFTAAARSSSEVLESLLPELKVR